MHPDLPLPSPFHRPSAIPLTLIEASTHGAWESGASNGKRRGGVRTSKRRDWVVYWSQEWEWVQGVDSRFACFVRS